MSFLSVGIHAALTCGTGQESAQNQVPYPLSGTQLGAHSTVYTTRPCFSQRERTLPHRDRGGTN